MRIPSHSVSSLTYFSAVHRNRFRGFLCEPIGIFNGLLQLLIKPIFLKALGIIVFKQEKPMNERTSFQILSNCLRSYSLRKYGHYSLKLYVNYKRFRKNRRK